MAASSSSTPLPAPPAELKALAPFLQRANELAKADTVMSYWSLYHAAQLGVAVTAKAQDKETRPFLYSLMDRLEELKAMLANNDAATSDEAGSAYVENFALKVFVGADNEDRSGKADRNTARKFLAASNFFELLTIFGPLSEEASEKRTYAKWKAAEISRAIKEGRKPAPGPPGWDPEEEKRQAAAELSAEKEAQQAVEEAKDDDDLLAREIARLTAPSGPVGETQGVKTDGHEADGRDVTAAEEPVDEGSPYGHAISPPPGVEEFSAADRRAPARLSYDAASGLNNIPSTPDKQTGGAISPPTSNPSHSPNFSHPLRPQFQRGLSGSSPGPGGSGDVPSAPSAPSSYFLNAPAGGGQGSPSLNATPGEVTAPGRPLPLTPQQLQERAQDPFAAVQLPTSPPQPQPQQPSAPAVSSHAAPLMPTAPPLPSVPPAAAVAASAPPPPAPAPTAAPAAAPVAAVPAAPFPEVLSPQLTSKAQRLAKFAISALDYDDLETARRQLREALDVVEGRTAK